MMFKALLAILTLPGCCISLEAQTADEIISRHIQATGGLKALKSIQTMRIVQRVDTGDPAKNFEFVIFRKRGNKFRLENSASLSEQDKVPMISGCDGHHGWSQLGNAPAQTGSGPDVMCHESPDIDSPLLDYKAKGYAVELEGKEKVEGRDAYHLQLTRQKGHEPALHYYFDAQSFLLVKISTESHDQHHEDIYSDYREVQGIMFAFCDEMRWRRVGHGPSRRKQVKGANAPDEAGRQKQSVEKLEFNIPLDDSLFRIPQNAVMGPHVVKR